MHPVILLRLVIVDAPPPTGEMPEVHRHNYVYQGVELMDRTMRAAVLEHEEVYAYDGAGEKVVEHRRKSPFPPHWFCVPHVPEDSR